MNKPAIKPLPELPQNWETRPVVVQLQDDQRRLTIQFANAEKMAAWIAEYMNRPALGRG